MGTTPEILSVLQTYPPLSILCADTHHYEKGRIVGGSTIIPQEIVGSGGASPNIYKDTLTPFSLGGPFFYEIISEPTESYGFLLVSGFGVSEFIPVLPWSAVGGSRSTRKRRNHKKMTRRRAHH